MQSPLYINSINDRVRKSNSEIHLEYPKPRIAKSILNNKRTSIPNLKLYYRVIVKKSAWYWYRDRQVDQWNIIEDPDMNEYTYGQLIFRKEAQSIQWKKE